MTDRRPSDQRVSRTRRAEIVAALSLATDFGTGHPIERSLRACLLAVTFGRTLGFSDELLAEIYYVALLRWSGCTADDHRAKLFGDEIALGPEIDQVELWNPAEMLGFLARTIAADEPPLQRVGKLSYALATGISRSEVAAIAHCEVAQNLATRLGLGDGVHRALGQIFERWDGRGVPGIVRGDEMARSTRAVQIAMDAELFFRVGGLDAVQALLRRREGRTYDPELSERFGKTAPKLFAALHGAPVWELALDAEPGPQPLLTDDQLDRALHAIADFTDLRSPTFRNHSPAVAMLAEAAARGMGLSEEECCTVRHAGLVHDIGMVAIPLRLFDHKGPLSDSDWERLRLHPYYTERILARPARLAQIGAVATLHHERLDGTGYHRGVPASLLPAAARILAAADVYRALVEPRSHRSALPAERAAELLRGEGKQGRLDPEAVRAVLAAAGHHEPAGRRVHVAGLTEREVEVLRLLASGLSNRRMARALTISERTIDHHVRHIYNKIGVSTRAGAALFAMQHQLLQHVPEAS
jgi:HD-GYP domain-containing protein (c-di-GMP phosphodiesterase class II)